MKVITFGELMMRLTPPGYRRLLQAETFEVAFGGAEANVAVSLCCLGAEAGFVTRLPGNDLGQAALNSLRRWGVDTRHIVRGGDRLGVYYQERGAAQRPAAVLYDRAGSAFAQAAAGDFDWPAILEGADWLHLSGITPALGEALGESCLAACRAARAAGVTVSFDPNYRSKLWGIPAAADYMRRILPLVDVLITNENQAADLLGVRVPPAEIHGDDVTDAGYLALARELLERYGLRRVAIAERRTFAAEDNSFCAKLYDGERLCSSPRYRMDIVDRIGSGDAFAAGLIYALRAGFDTQRAVSFAAAAGCLKHSVEGDYSLLSAREVLALAEGRANGRVQR